MHRLPRHWGQRRTQDRRQEGLGEARVAGSHEPHEERARRHPPNAVARRQSQSHRYRNRARDHLHGESVRRPLDRTHQQNDPGRHRSGEEIVQQRCAKCHQTGEGGAPRIGDQTAWIPRLKQGIDVVVRSAIKGHGGMPARGGQADLSDAELRSAIVYMMNPAGAPAKTVASASAGTGQDYRVIDGTAVYFGATPADVDPAQSQGVSREDLRRTADRSRPVFRDDRAVRRQYGTTHPRCRGEGARFDNVECRTREVAATLRRRGRAYVRELFRDGRGRTLRGQRLIMRPGMPDAIQVRFGYAHR